MRKHLIQANTFIMLMLCASHVFSANFLGLAEYEEIGSPVYLGSLTLDKKPNNPAHIHSMKGKKAMRFHIQKAGYPLRSFIRHLDSWATKGSAKNLKAKKTTKDSITQLQHSIKDALNRHFVKRGDIFQIDISDANIHISINGKTVLKQHSKNLSDYFLNIWAGDPLADAMFYNQLVNTKGAHYQALKEKLSVVNANFNASNLSFRPSEEKAPTPAAKPPIHKQDPVTSAEKTVAVKASPKPPSLPQPSANTKKTQAASKPQAKTKKTADKKAATPVVIKKTAAVQKAKPVAVAQPAVIKTPEKKHAAIPVARPEVLPKIHTPKVLSEKRYTQHVQSLLLEALKQSPLPIDVNTMPPAMLYISHQGIVHSGVFSISPKTAVNISKKERMILKRAAVSISPLPITQAMKDAKGLYVLKVNLQR